MRVQRVSAMAVFALMVFLLFRGLVSAHHAVAGYDNDKQIELRGVVVEYTWRNPHVFVVWDVKDKDGKVVQWTGEMNSTTSMIAVGMNRNSLKAGDEIIVRVNPSKSGNPHSVIRKITTADGKLIVDRFPPQ